MIGHGKKFKKRHEKEKKHERRGGGHPEIHGNSINNEDISPYEKENDDEESVDSKEESGELVKEGEDGVEPIFDIESYRPTMTRAALILETEKGIRVFETTWLKNSYRIKEVVNAFKEKAEDKEKAAKFKNAQKLIDYFMRNPIKPVSKKSQRTDLSRYYIEFNEKRFPLSLFTLSGRSKRGNTESEGGEKS